MPPNGLVLLFSENQASHVSGHVCVLDLVKKWYWLFGSDNVWSGGEYPGSS